MSIAQNLQIVERRILAACERSGRDRAFIKLLAVSKLHDQAKIREAFAAGQVDFGENYAQEALEKQNLLSDLPLRWHFIGRIQSNKVKMLAGKFAVVHSVDSAKIADFFNRQELPSPQDILLQFNVAEEANKGGASEEALFETADLVIQHRNVRLLGLMVMPPLVTEAEQVRPYFRRAREVLEQLREKYQDGISEADGLRKHPLNELSMGTSQDFEVAIEEGATWIRLGTDIFGSRT